MRAGCQVGTKADELLQGAPRVPPSEVLPLPDTPDTPITYILIYYIYYTYILITYKFLKGWVSDVIAIAIKLIHVFVRTIQLYVISFSQLT